MPNILDCWRDDLVGCLIGATATADRALVDAGVVEPHMGQQRRHAAYTTNIPIQPAGRFRSRHLVVAMPAMTPKKAIRAIQITTRFPAAQSAPIHIGNPGAIGINDLNKPELSPPAVIKEGEIPIFWAGGVTAQIVALESEVEFMITHAPGHMFISDLSAAAMAVS